MKKKVKCPTCGASIWLYSLGTHLIEQHGFSQVYEQQLDSYKRWWPIKCWIRNKEEIK